MRSSNIGKKRWGLKRSLVAASYLLSLAAVVALFSGVTYGLLSATSSSATSTFATGTVTLDNNVTGHCNASNLLPDDVSHDCTLTATYGGNAPGYVALDVLIETQAGSGGTPLYNPGDTPKDLQVSIASTNPNVPAYTVPVTPLGSCPVGAPGGSTCYEADNLIVSTSALTASDPEITFTTTYSVPTSSTTDYQGGAAQAILTAHAAQADNNSAAGCTAGHTCNAVNWN